MSDRSNKPEALREVLANHESILVPECYSALTARIAAAAGFEVLYCGGDGLAAMQLGIPDHGIITMTEVADLVAPIAASVDVPLIVDADQGGETALSVRRSVECLERSGAAGLHIEDTLNPKHLPWLARDASPIGDRLQPVDRMRARIAAAVEARKDSSFVIIARSDGLPNGMPIDDVIERANAYAEVGADLFFCLGLGEEDINVVAAAIPIPLVGINHPRDVLVASRLKMSIFAGYAVRWAASGYKQLVDSLASHGMYDDLVQARSLARADYLKLLHDDNYLAVARQWLALEDA